MSTTARLLVLLAIWSFGAGCAGTPRAGDALREGLGRSPDEVRAQLERFDRLVGNVPTPARRAAVILQRNVDLDFGRYEFARTETQTVHVFDAPDASVFEQEFELGTASIRSARAWHARADGSAVSSDGSWFTLHETAGATRSARLRVTDVRAGDRLGWTVSTIERNGRAHLREPLALEHYLLAGRLRIGGDALLTHRVVPRNTDSTRISVEVTERKRGFPHGFAVTFEHVPPRADRAFALPPLLRDPYLEIVRQGRFYQELDTWLMSNDWDVWVALELGQPASWVSDTPEIRAAAERLVAGTTTDGEAAHALYRFVRDAITTTDPGPDESLLGDGRVAINLDLAQMERDLDEEIDSPLAQRFRDAQQLPPAESSVSPPRRLGPARSPEVVLAAGSGTRLEKTVLLVSLLGAVHLECRIALARDRSFGPHDHESTGRWQFTDAIVVLLTPDLRPDLWYCPTRDDLPAGVLPVGLQNSAMLTVRDHFEEGLEESWQRARESVGARIELRVPAWLELVRVADWARWARTPGAPFAPCGATQEVLWWADAEQPSRVRVQVTGEVRLTPSTFVTERHPSARDVVVVDVREPAASDHRSASLDAELVLPALPAPTDGVWRLPGAQIFGVGPLQAFEREAGVFHVDRTIEHMWRVELPLPPGWSTVVPIAEFVQQNERLAYVANARVEDWQLVVERRLRLMAGTSTSAQVENEIGNIRLFEEGWLVVRAASTGD